MKYYNYLEKDFRAKQNSWKVIDLDIDNLSGSI